eukprot:CAMPEP_0178437616 /NCGR_PEP_ID=MMETSP0689_2-20121128/35106_1 /TAXON_ID=160604 /ORGANISM="Amphidinium massartii, Strain CS-259" /LENGTH=281 /DNA_ID=CAMNT_0020059867 /DNA_START=62 /DNA_END=904 /DNA_ORIENTATION=+
MAMKGTLVLVHELSEEQVVTHVDVQFQGLDQPSLKVPFKGLGLSPPDQNYMTEVLETGFPLILRGADISEVWQLHGKAAAQSERLQQLLDLQAAHPLLEQRDIVTDFHICALAHANSVRLTPFQAAVFHSIMTRMLQSLKSSTPSKNVDNYAPVSAGFSEFEKLMLQHMKIESGEQKDVEVGVFSANEVKMLTDFAAETFFKHYHLYAYCINFTQEVQTLRYCMPFHTPLQPLDLMDAKPRPPPEKETVIQTRNPFSMMANVNVSPDGHKNMDATQPPPTE